MNRRVADVADDWLRRIDVADPHPITDGARRPWAAREFARGWALSVDLTDYAAPRDLFRPIYVSVQGGLGDVILDGDALTDVLCVGSARPCQQALGEVYESFYVAVMYCLSGVMVAPRWNRRPPFADVAAVRDFTRPVRLRIPSLAVWRFLAASAGLPSTHLPTLAESATLALAVDVARAAGRDSLRKWDARRERSKAHQNYVFRTGLGKHFRRRLRRHCLARKWSPEVYAAVRAHFGHEAMLLAALSSAPTVFPPDFYDEMVSELLGTRRQIGSSASWRRQAGDWWRQDRARESARLEPRSEDAVCV